MTDGVGGGGVSDGCQEVCKLLMQVTGHWRGEGVSISIINQGGPLGLMDIIRWGGKGGGGSIVSLVDGCRSGLVMVSTIFQLAAGKGGC